MNVTYPRTGVSVDSIRYQLTIWSGVFLIELLLVVAYFQVSPAEAGSLRYLVYPFMWINVAAWAVYRTVTVGRSNASTGRRMLGIAVAVAYFLVLLGLSGLLSVQWPPTNDIVAHLVWAVPGWGPVAVFGAPVITIRLVPFQVIGFVGLSYVVYVLLVTAAHRAGAAIPAVLSCVGCAAPLLLAMGGSGGAIAARLAPWSYDIGTAVFVLTALLLVATHEHAERGATRCSRE